jgi:DNA-binding transcriptional LysR family regulator
MKGVRAFVEVAQEGHFGRAAEHLGITQSGLSQMIKALEQAVGARLIDRTTRTVALTEVGEAFLIESHELLLAHKLFEDRMANVVHGTQGLVRLGFVATAALRIVPWIAQIVHEKAPRIRLSLNELASVEQLSQLKSGEIDVGVLREITSSQGLEIVPIVSEPLLVAVPNSHQLKDRDSVELRELKNEQFIMFPRTNASHLNDHIIRLCHNTGFTPHVIEHAFQFTTILGLVSSNAGIAIVPESVDAIKLPNVAYIKIQDPQAHSQIYLARRIGDRSSPSAKHLVELMLQSHFHHAEI